MTNTSSSNTITINTDTLDLDIDHYYGHTIDVSSITTSTINTTFIDNSYDDLISLDGDFTITLNDPVEFEDYMPDVAKVKDMCKYYPALEKAYENFKTIYAMVHQDWQGRQDAEDQFPF